LLVDPRHEKLKFWGFSVFPTLVFFRFALRATAQTPCLFLGRGLFFPPLSLPRCLKTFVPLQKAPFSADVLRRAESSPPYEGLPEARAHLFLVRPSPFQPRYLDAPLPLHLPTVIRPFSPNAVPFPPLIFCQNDKALNSGLTFRFRRIWSP